MNRVVFLNSFLLCPQKKTIGNIRFITYVTNVIASYSDGDLQSLIASNAMVVKPNQLVNFFNIKMSGVRALLNKDTSWLESATWLSPNGKIEPCFKSITYISYQGYYVEFNEEFLKSIINNLDQAVLIDCEKFGKIDSVYSQVLYGQYITSKEGVITYSPEGLRKIFDLQDCYSNNYMLHKKCIKDPCDKLNKIFKINLDSKKISFGGGDFLWVVGDERSISNAEAALAT